MKQIKVAEPSTGEEEIKRVAKVIKSGRFLQGPNVKKLEERFAEYIGTDYAIATSSGTTALQISLDCLGIGPGDEVLVPAMSFFSTATSVIHQNAVPTFSDVEETAYTLSPESFEANVTDRTEAVIPVHLFGHPAEMEEINRIAKENSISVIEDSAQAHGAEYHGKKVGSLGDVGCFSFYATKNMTTGEGGMITTDSAEVAERAKKIRSHGMSDRNTHEILGYNYRMNEMEAAIGVVQLDKLEDMNEKRIKISKEILNRLKDVEWLETATEKPDCKHVYFWCPVRVKEDKLGMKTSELRQRLLEKGIETRHRYYEPLYKQRMLLEKNVYPKACPLSCPYYRVDGIDYSEFYCKSAEKFAGTLIGLPNHPNLEEADIERVVNTVRSITSEG